MQRALFLKSPSKISKSGILMIACLTAVFVQSCSLSKHPFLVVSVCLRSPADVEEFRDHLYEIADTEGLSTADRSSETEIVRDNLKNPKVDRTGAAINLSFQGKDNIGFGVSDLGEGYQAAIGFSEGRNALLARQLSDSVIKSISEKWQVEVAPAGRGAFPIDGCD